MRKMDIHNRARGTHGIRPMSEIVLDLTRYGWNDEKATVFKTILWLFMM